MKALMLLSLIFSFNAFSKTDYEITCNMKDCFRNGWTMKSKNNRYWLKNNCVANDCEMNGWKSIDSNGDMFEVRCQPRGCFTEGWVSINTVKGKKYLDSVQCKGGACLNYGWTVKTGYDLSGGNVTCGNYDCSKFGGVSFWRGRASKTVCKDWDCYTNGWYLTVY